MIHPATKAGGSARCTWREMTNTITSRQVVDTITFEKIATRLHILPQTFVMFHMYF